MLIDYFTALILLASISLILLEYFNKTSVLNRKKTAAVVILMLLSVAFSLNTNSYTEHKPFPHPEPVIELQAVYNNDTGKDSRADSLNITIRNRGDSPVNLADMELFFELNSSGKTFDPRSYPYRVQQDSNCFRRRNGDGKLYPGGTYTCKTGISWPEPSQAVKIIVSMEDTNVSTYLCSPAVEKSLTC